MTNLREYRSRAYWLLWGGLHRLLGTRLYERKWASRIKSRETVLSEVDHPHRPWLIESFRPFGRLDSILEVGSGHGANVRLLAGRYPETTVVGLDVNQIAVDEGNLILQDLGIANARLEWGKASDLSQYQDGAFDLVFTDAILIYVGPDRIRQTVAEMKRVARKGLALLELHDEDGRGRDPVSGRHTRDGWVRDYARLLSEFYPRDRISVRKVPTEVWPAGRWPLYGNLISALT